MYSSANLVLYSCVSLATWRVGDARRHTFKLSTFGVSLFVVMRRQVTAAIMFHWEFALVRRKHESR